MELRKCSFCEADCLGDHPYRLCGVGGHMCRWCSESLGDAVGRWAKRRSSEIAKARERGAAEHAAALRLAVEVYPLATRRAMRGGR